MKLNPSWFVYLCMILSGVILVWSAPNWFWTWVGFELSLMGFLPMLTLDFFVVESMMKYFLVQAGGSGLFLGSFLWGGLMSGLSCLLGMALKLGIFPFYHWVPSVVKAMSWESCFFLFSFQKVPALLVVCQLQLVFSVLLGSLSIFVGGLLGFNQTNLRVLLAYSSIGHGGWLLLCSTIGPQLMGFYFVVYFLVNSVLFYNLWSLDLVRISHGLSNFEMSVLLFTLAGLPPFTIFFLKVYVLSFLYLYVFSLVWAVLGSMLSIFYYLLFLIPTGVLRYRLTVGVSQMVVLCVSLSWPMLTFLGV